MENDTAPSSSPARAASTVFSKLLPHSHATVFSNNRDDLHFGNEKRAPALATRTDPIPDQKVPKATANLRISMEEKNSSQRLSTSSINLAYTPVRSLTACLEALEQEQTSLVSDRALSPSDQEHSPALKTEHTTVSCFRLCWFYERSGAKRKVRLQKRNRHQGSGSVRIMVLGSSCILRAPSTAVLTKFERAGE